MEEGKLLSESLSTVKIQVQQMRRYLVRRTVTPNSPRIVMLSRSFIRCRNLTSLWMR